MSLWNKKYLLTNPWHSQLSSWSNDYWCFQKNNRIIKAFGLVWQRFCKWWNSVVAMVSYKTTKKCIKKDNSIKYFFHIYSFLYLKKWLKGGLNSLLFKKNLIFFDRVSNYLEPKEQQELNQLLHDRDYTLSYKNYDWSTNSKWWIILFYWVVFKGKKI